MLTDCNILTRRRTDSSNNKKEGEKGERSNVLIVGLTGVVTIKEHLYYKEAGMSEAVVKPITTQLVERKL